MPAAENPHYFIYRSSEAITGQPACESDIAACELWYGRAASKNIALAY
jgi:hypothetical protein